MFVEALLTLMLQWKVPEESEQSKLARWRPLVEQTYAECQRYAPRSHVKAETCTIVAVNTMYWETGLQPKYQLAPKSGPSGEECFFQIHRQAESIPFDEWKPLHAYGTRHGVDTQRCVEDGVRILSYHMWRCHLDEGKLRGPDNRHQLWHLYSEYYKPTPECWRFKGGPVYHRASMAKRLLKRLPPTRTPARSPRDSSSDRSAGSDPATEPTRRAPEQRVASQP